MAKHANSRWITEKKILRRPIHDSQGYPKLIRDFFGDNLRFEPRSVYILHALALIGTLYWLFLQDNQAGLLATSDGIKWFVVKTLVLAGLTLTSAIIIGLILRFTKVRQ